MGALALSRLTILKAQCPKLYPENASAYEVGFDRFSQIIKKKLPDIVEIQATRECRAALENDEKEVAALSRDKLQAECVFLLRDIEKLNSLESR